MTCGFHVDVYHDNTAYTSPVVVRVYNYYVDGVAAEVCWFVDFDIKITWTTECGISGTTEENVSTGDEEVEELTAYNTYSTCTPPSPRPGAQ